MPSSHYLNHHTTWARLSALALIAIAFLLGKGSLVRCQEPIPSNHNLEQIGTPFRPSRWEPLPTLPDWEGFAGAFIGTVDDHLVVAGGANFLIANHGKAVPSYGTTTFGRFKIQTQHGKRSVSFLVHSDMEWLFRHHKVR